MQKTARAMASFMLALIVATAACTSTGKTPLEATQWTLVGWSISSQRADAIAITARFAGGQVSGHTGVNSYSGPYTSSSAGQLSVGVWESTQIGGSEAAMHAERAYMSLLGQVSAYTIADHTLTLYDKGGSQLLIFKATGQ